jgi:hypothetical protein
VVPPGSEHPLFELMSNQITPIIAHPERNMMLMNEPERFYELISIGVLGQMDTGSITGQFGRKVQQAARVMLESGLIHFIASDCHNMRNRLPRMSAAVAGGDCKSTHAIANRNPSVGRKPITRATATLPQKRRWFFLEDAKSGSNSINRSSFASAFPLSINSTATSTPCFRSPARPLTIRAAAAFSKTRRGLAPRNT